MKTRQHLPVIWGLCSLLVVSVHAFEIDWSTVDGGGGTGSAGTFTLSGTIGQPDATTGASGSFKVEGGFWNGLLGPVNGTWISATGGEWTTATNWDSNPDYPHSAGDTANFRNAIAASSTITLSTSVTVGAIYFDSSPNYSIGSGGSITLNNHGGGAVIATTATNGTGSHSIAANLVAAENLTLNSSTAPLTVAGTVANGGYSLLVGGGSASVTLGGAVSGSGGLVKTGASLLTLAGTNSYSGATVINAGTVRVTGSSPNSAMSVNSGGRLSGTGTVGSAGVNSGGNVSPGP